MSETLKFGNGKWAVKEGSTLAYNDTNGNFKPLPFTFDRAGSATRVNKQGLIEVVPNNEPRIDFLNDSKGALLLETQSTNLVTHSEDFTDVSWFKENSTVTLSTEKALGKDAYILEDDSVNGYHLLTFDTSLSSGTHTRSFYVKKVNCRYIYFSVAKQPTSNVNTWIFDLDNNVFTQNGSDGIGQDFEVLSNSWVRISFTNITSASGNRRITVGLSNVATGSATDLQYTGIGNQVLVSMAQYEPLGYATSYIPTQGSIGTRVAESCSGAGNDQVFNDSEGVLFVEISAFQEISTSNEHIVLRNSASTDFSNSILIQHRNDGALRIYSDGFASANIQFIVTDINWLVNNKIAIQYDSIGSNYKLFLNGTTKARFSSAANQSVVGLNDISSYWGSVSNPFYGNVKQIKYFNKALSDAELAALTKI